MPRARSLKPGFFNNEDLIELPFEYRLLFAGLWTLADREGRLEDRPKRIKLHLFPGDNVDVDAGLSALAARGFIRRYRVGEGAYVQVTNWAKHQSPHVKEAASEIPAQEEPGASPVPAPDEHQTSRSYSLTPSSLTPSSLTADNARETRSDQVLVSEAAVIDAVARIRAAYPRRAGRADWLGAERAIRRLVDSGVGWGEIEAAASRYANYCAATGNSDTQFVLGPEKFFGADDRPWQQPWAPPASKAQRTQDANVLVAQEWLRAGT